MKLKYITLISFIVFVGTILALGTYSTFKPNAFQELQNSTPNPIDNTNIITDVAKSTGILLTTEEISKHNTASDCYIIVKNSVYSVAGFIDKHPGGRQRILDMCGKEATKIFSAIHSNFAWNLLKNYYVGNVGGVLDNVKLQSIKSSSDLSASNSSTGGVYEKEDEDEDEYDRD